jgi:myo-inositol-1(or 4)-monophosphatase
VSQAFTWPDLDDLVQRVRQAAAEEILPRFRHTRRDYKPDGSVVTEADLAVQERLGRELAALYPNIGLLGEEMPPARQQALVNEAGGPFWCLDPVDGTSNFAAGLPFFSISLALLQGHEPVLGIVYDPTRDECFTAIKGQGAWLNGERLRCVSQDVPLNRCLAMVDFKRLDKALIIGLATRPPYSSLRYTGSGALEWCWLAASRFQLYLHGRQKLWDYAAGALILAEAGGVFATLEGEPVFAPGVLTRSVVAAPDARLFAAWRQAIARCRAV